MTFRIAINGYGRIGRCFVRALHESPLREEMQIVAINEPADLESMAYLTRFDSTHGRFPGTVELDGDKLRIDGQPIAVSHARSPGEVDWRGLGLDLLVEASGRYPQRAGLEAFIAAGCPRLLLSHPGQTAADVDRTVVIGVNHGALTGGERLVSAASCTTNAIVPVLALLDSALGIEQAMATTLHSVMNDQPPIDGYHHSDLRRTRSAMQSMVPVATGLARGIERLLPGLTGRVTAKSIRVPVTNVSAIDLVLSLRNATDAATINAQLQQAADTAFAGLLAVSAEPHASIDFNHSPQSAIVDAGQTRVAGRMANLLVWFDNEWGYANRMIELAALWRQRLTAAGAAARG
ncbi:MAG: erythrose-4-phosphate dehydrogenase [Sulfuritalea sp.]|nr:erythrose-4-phosphate dehydrogenase [Sulfuritalea sp.]